ncbi:Peroxisomal membrane protein 2 [Cocos nucifera]|uniref:Peroxisomal membrane protein 2 n=1 Tax=Cocos nucifera TaxID=13894 RepID=A0A8K0IV03_COCNU|nr:Peroxisomal membrane protein 2 [Cocos nucifera]
MAAINSVASPSRFLPLPCQPRPSSLPSTSKPFLSSSRFHGTLAPPPWRPDRARRDLTVAASVTAAEDLDVIPVKIPDSTDQQDGVVSVAAVREQEEDGGGSSSHNHVGGFAFENGGVGGVTAGSAGGGGSLYASPSSSSLEQGEDVDRLVDRAINAAIVLAAGTYAMTKLLTIDRDYWHGWTIYEILRYAPQHNWTAYEEALKANPVLAKMVISGVVYSLGDWIAQCYEGKPLFDFDRARMFRSGLVGFTLHGSISHYYYQFCESLFPFQDWWVVPAKVLLDQTAWAAIWNSIYYAVLGFLRFESPSNIFSELKATFWPMLTAGWKLWPFAHLITYGVVPVEQRLLWVDCVELVWVTILSTYSNEKSEARNSEAMSEPPAVPEELIK